MDNKSNFKKIIMEWLSPILIAIVIAFIINKFIIFQVEIPSGSMIPTLNKYDRLFVRRVYNKEKLERGDLVVFYFEPKDDLYIKRLIGLPNDKIVINNGIVTVNGEVLIEDYIKEAGDFNGEYKVPEGEYFFLGDNRTNSNDSRKWKYPYIKAKDIKGKAVIKVYPFSEIGFIK